MFLESPEMLFRPPAEINLLIGLKMKLWLNLY